MKKASKKEKIIVEELNEEGEIASDKEESSNKVVNFIKSLIPYVVIFVRLPAGSIFGCFIGTSIAGANLHHNDIFIIIKYWLCLWFIQWLDEMA